MKKIVIFILILIVSSLSWQCSGISDLITNLQRCQFKLGRVTGFSLAGVPLGNITNLNNIGVLDVIKLTSAFANGQLPASFTLNVLAKNPNDGTGGTKNTTAILKRLEWKLLIDSKETINGNINRSIEIPGVGQEITIPVEMSLDLLKFFKDQGYDNIINLALAIGGKSGSSSRLTLKAKPTVDTFLGPITYPGYIDIVDREFRSE